MKKGGFVVGIDLKDVCPDILIHLRFRKYPRFYGGKKLLQWGTLPFGLTCSMRVLTKVLKPVSAYFHRQFLISLMFYMDYEITLSGVGLIQQ